MESQVYADEMRKEMIQEIESARPEFLVSINVPTSWLAQKGSTTITTILEWFNSYCNNFYNIVGLIEIYPERSICRWNEQARNYTPVSYWIAVYKRK